MSYNRFQPFYPSALRHIERHFPHNSTPGSKFNSRFKDPKEVAEYAWEKIKYAYRGELLIREINFQEVIGLEALIALKDIPKGVGIKKRTREIPNKNKPGRYNSYTIWTAEDMRLQETKTMTVIAGPLERTRVHTFLTIYPGRYAPDFSDQEFWSKHALISPRKQKKRRRH
jgi:hypothetical protein